jgi:hypothetical protein
MPWTRTGRPARFFESCQNVTPGHPSRRLTSLSNFVDLQMLNARREHSQAFAQKGRPHVDNLDFVEAKPPQTEVTLGGGELACAKRADALWHVHEVVKPDFLKMLASVRKAVLDHPDQSAEADFACAKLLRQLTKERTVRHLTRLDAPARQSPEWV